MGDCSRPASSFALRRLLRLLSVLAALAVFCVSGRASATGIGDAPMCGEHNESVAAPPIFHGVSDSSLSALPCQAPEQLATGPTTPISPRPVVVHQTPERVLAFNTLGVAQSEATRVPVDVAQLDHERPGHAEGVFRPPRA